MNINLAKRGIGIINLLIGLVIVIVLGLIGVRIYSAHTNSANTDVAVERSVDDTVSMHFDHSKDCQSASKLENSQTAFVIPAFCVQIPRLEGLELVTAE